MFIGWLIEQVKRWRSKRRYQRCMIRETELWIGMRHDKGYPPRKRRPRGGDVRG